MLGTASPYTAIRPRPERIRPYIIIRSGVRRATGQRRFFESYKYDTCAGVVAKRR